MTEKDEKFEAEVAAVRVGHADLIDTRAAAIARRDRLAGEYEAACELVAECTLDVKAASGAPDRVLAAALGVSRGTVAHQVAVARALRGGAAKPSRDRGGRSPREKRRAAQRATQGLAPWETPVGPPIGPAPTFIEQLAATADEAEFDTTPEPTKVVDAPIGPRYEVLRGGGSDG